MGLRLTVLPVRERVLTDTALGRYGCVSVLWNLMPPLGSHVIPRVVDTCVHVCVRNLNGGRTPGSDRRSKEEV